MHLLDFVKNKDELIVETEDEWNEFANRVNVGDFVSGSVIAVKNYGVFIDFGEPFPALVEVPNLHKGRYPVDVDHLPPIGEPFNCEIIQIAPHRRAVRAIECSPT
tara:strand:+ start:1585 stop:1899 length:315 start_codon:yes stop_codon:yes gene_type:complete